MLIWIIGLWLACHFAKPQFITRRKSQLNTTFKQRKKPQWVVNKIIYFKALMPQAGCRVLAASFNRQFGHRESVSKTWVANTIRNHQYEIAMRRRKLKNRKPKPIANNRIWGMDMTGKHDLNKTNHQILGIVDHGSRANLYLNAIKSKASIQLLRIILDTIEKFLWKEFSRKPSRMRVSIMDDTNKSTASLSQSEQIMSVFLLQGYSDSVCGFSESNTRKLM